MTPSPAERGAALITVLMAVAILATVAVSIMEDVSRTLKRTANIQSTSQALWYAHGAEQIAAVQFAGSSDAARAELQRLGVVRRTIGLPRGAATLEVRVGAQCFNLNSIVSGANDAFEASPVGIRRFTALLVALGLNEQHAAELAVSLADWIDTDGAAGTGEDAVYSRGASPYRTSGSLLADETELRAIRGFTPQIYRLVRPYVCALPTTSPAVINPNLIGAEDAVLITMGTEGRVGPDQARAAILDRPRSGWREVRDFWASPALARQDHADSAKAAFGFDLRYVRVTTVATFADAEVETSALYAVDGGRPALMIRRWTGEE